MTEDTENPDSQVSRKPFDYAIDTLSKTAYDRAPVFGVISPPFTDVNRVCKKLICHLIKLKTDGTNTRDEKASIVIIDGLLTTDEYNLAKGDNSCRGYYIKHADLLDKKMIDNILDTASDLNRFVLYWSTEQLDRGQYISAGIITEDDAIKHFIKKGYVKEGAISADYYSVIPRNITAIRYLEDEVIERTISNEELNREIILNWKEYIEPIIENNLDHYQQYFKKAMSNLKIEAYRTLILISMSDRPVPKDAVNYLWKDDDDQKETILECLKKHRFIAEHNDYYYCTPFVQIVLKQYLKTHCSRQIPKVVETICESINNLSDGRFLPSLILYLLNHINEITISKKKRIDLNNHLFDVLSFNLIGLPSTSQEYCLKKCTELCCNNEDGRMAWHYLQALFTIYNAKTDTYAFDRIITTIDGIDVKKLNSAKRSPLDHIFKLNSIRNEVTQLKTDDRPTLSIIEDISDSNSISHNCRIYYYRSLYVQKCNRAMKSYNKLIGNPDELNSFFKTIEDEERIINKDDDLRMLYLLNCKMYCELILRGTDNNDQKCHLNDYDQVCGHNVEYFRKKIYMYLDPLIEAHLLKAKIQMNNKDTSNAKTTLDYVESIEREGLHEGELDDCWGEYYNLMGDPNKSLSFYSKAISAYILNGQYYESILVKCKILSIKAKQNDYKKTTLDLKEELTNVLEISLSDYRSRNQYVEHRISECISKAFN